jgi:SAM-dependent methyltransferase
MSQLRTTPSKSKLPRVTRRLPPDGGTLPPGTILQRIYVRKRLGPLAPGRFVDVGTGAGGLSRILLDLGWSGVGWDLNDRALARAKAITSDYIETGRYELRHGDWLAADPEQEADLVVAELLLEHFDDEAERRYFERTKRELARNGLGVLIVPASIEHWGIEDEVAGHVRRYTRESLRRAVETAGFRVEHLMGLTWPLSNLLLPLSNYLVSRAEQHNLALSRKHRTIASGARDVPWKTRFPAITRLVLNEWTLRPFHLAQLAGGQREDAMILYCEFRRTS